jgi:hypothetical protein
MQRSLDCVSTTFWYAGPSALPDETSVAALTTSEAPIRLETADGVRFFLRASQAFHFERRPGLVKDWKVGIDGYNYGIQTMDGKDVIGWHFHPPRRDECHMHVYSDVAGIPVHGTHVPTSRVTFEQVAHYLLDELGVIPQRDDWRKVLTANTDRHLRFRTWSGPKKPGRSN